MIRIYEEHFDFLLVLHRIVKCKHQVHLSENGPLRFALTADATSLPCCDE